MAHGYNFLYNGDFAGDGYIYISVDGRGTPAPKEPHGVNQFIEILVG